MRIFVTGDTHSDLSRFSFKKFPEGRTLTKDDIMIVLGDFGCVWFNEKSANYSGEQRNLAWLNEKPWTTVFVDGNHENFDRLNALPVVDFCGGKAHQIASSIFHLMRGECFTFNGKKFLAMGGANSIDKEGRTVGKSWWKEELLSRADEEHVLDTLEKLKYNVDYILTHTVPTSLKPAIESYLGGKIHGIEEDPTEKFLEHVMSQMNFNHHYFGHFHLYMPNLDALHTGLYHEIVELK